MTIETTADQFVIRVDRSGLSATDIEQVLKQLRTLELAARLSGTEAETVSVAPVDLFIYPRLNPDTHRTIIDFGIEGDEITTGQPFAHISDAGAYVHEQRKQSWQ